ncbi:MAG: helix-turn-helix transcriptional regulator, partial [Acutalibacteraceae bacterium]|nr:helix-turn-helix transcriptional regulator [Acutalibacteraceae bacterium]
MEFNEKLQELRKQKGFTQEELAQALYVSRTAISKWESGRGYPNIDSLKAIAQFFGVTVDALLREDAYPEVGKDEKADSAKPYFAWFDIAAVLLLL